MTEVTTTLRTEPWSSFKRHRFRLKPTTETHPLITEQQVLFSTAAAVAVPPAKTRRLSDAVQGRGPVSHLGRKRLKAACEPEYPKRHVWLENSQWGAKWIGL